jgi:hypothetical protein
MLFNSHVVSADATILIRSHSLYVSTVKMAKCGCRLPSRGLYGVTNIQLINGCSYVCWTLNHMADPLKSLVRTNNYFKVLKKFRSYSQAVNKGSLLASLLKREWFYWTCGSQPIISLRTLQFGGWNFCFHIHDAWEADWVSWDFLSPSSNPGSVVGRSKSFICFTKRPKRLQRPPSLPSIHAGVGLGGAVFPGVKLPIHLSLVQRLRMKGAIPSLPHMSSPSVCVPGNGLK